MKLSNLLKKANAFLIASSMMVSLGFTALAAENENTWENATTFTFSDSEIMAVNGDYTSYKISGTNLTINGEGTYLLDGSCSDGTVTVKKGTTGVTLVLNGLALTSSDTAPIACNKSTEVNIVVAENTVNSLTDSAYNNDDNYPDNTNAENAVIKCKDGSKITISGEGTLNIDSNGKNGIKSGATTDDEGEAYLTIRESTINIDSAVNDGINAEAALNIESGSITVNAADDGIHSDYLMNVGATGTNGPTVNITNSYEGLEAANLNVYSGNITIYASDDCMNAANSDLTDYSFTLNIAGGKLYMYTTEGDGIDSNGTLTISGGTVEVWSANTADNQPLDADGAVSITGGTVFAAGGSAGMGMDLSNGQAYLTFGFGSMGMGGGQGSTPGQPNRNSSSVSVAKGSEVSIKDSSGNTLYTATAPCSASYVFFSSADVTSGDTYTLYAGSTSVGSATADNSGSSSGGSGNQPTPPSGGQRPTPPSENGKTDDNCANGHTYTSQVTKEATCTSSGITTYTCTKCGYSYNEITAIASHSYKWTVTKEATYFTNGEQAYKCTVCGSVSQTKLIKKLTLKTPKFTVKAKGGKIVVKYKKSLGATGFVVRYTYKGKTVIKKFNTKKSVTRALKKLKSGKYKVSIRAFVKKNGKTAYSSWSAAKTVTVK